MAEKKRNLDDRPAQDRVARVRLLPGAGTVTINKRTLEDYFPRDTSRMRIMEPFEITETNGQYDMIVSVHGGGILGAGRRGAPRHFARAGEVSETLRPALRKAGC